MKDSLIISTKELFNKCLETLRKKNADYSGDSDSMKNFKVSAEIVNIKMSQGILTRLTDKVSRIGNLLSKDSREVNDETVLDTIEDLINYAAILHYAVESESLGDVVHLAEGAVIIGDKAFLPNKDQYITTRDLQEIDNADEEFNLALDELRHNGRVTRH
jgi:hypothetical protein